MNERIRELKEQAWEYAMAVHDGLIVPPLDKEVWPVDKVFDEKFAELIVRECAQIAVFKDSGTVATADVAGHMAAGRSIAARLIREHFGVEA
jgi:hypothetical protein